MVLALVLSLFATPSFAQATYAVKLGLNVAKIAFEEDEGTDFKSKMGFVGGVGVDVPLTGNLAISPEILFVQKGTKAEEGGFEAKIKMNNIDIPILLKANFMTAGTARPFIVVGPVLGFKAGEAKLEFEGEEDPNFDDDVSSTDFELAFGGGVQFGRAIVEARYNFGLKNLDKNGGDGDSAKHRGILVLVGVALGGQ
jgi:opacity protein-like surface antigen